jgi:hypothetical protein
MRLWALIVLLSAGCGSAAHAPSAKTSGDGGPEAGEGGAGTNQNDAPIDVEQADADAGAGADVSDAAAGEDGSPSAEASVACRAAESGGATGDGSTEDVPGIACPDPIGFTGADVCPAGHGVAVVIVSELALDLGVIARADLGANFLPFTGCETIGPCSLIPVSPPPAVRPQAGNITAVSGSSMLTTKPDPSTGAYVDAEFFGPFWTPGALLTFSAPGGSVPQFTGGFCAPAPVTITSPAVSEVNTFVVDRSKDLTVQWTGTGPGLVEVQIFSAFAPEAAVCYYPVASMAGVIPREVLQMFPPGTDYSVTFNRTVRKTVTVGDSCIELDATVSALNAAGAGIGGVRATLQ